ncbi:hypothetical protein B0H16DRAFT_1534664 [Mycena metata]|uniref:F-box domain-containing protein n=1 Tax=Mycena metata TaxID=1033252 RepID=A0AAD7JBM2_9AGAR|nr:hypothetical protein B0H16DRAFT_1534664 [Mycena metata]
MSFAAGHSPSQPILTLPPEILAEIFLHCLPKSPGPDPQNAPYSLCRVCRQFRAVAVSTPRLWSSLNVEFNEKTADEMDDICRIWISRARSLPLSLYLKDMNVRAPSPEATLLPTILGLSKQWRKLQICGSYDDSYWNLFEGGSLDGKVPLLEELSISGFDAVILHDAPKLRTLALDACQASLLVPWHQLTTLHADCLDIPSFLEILRDAINLLHASFGFAVDETTALPVSECRHATLQCLSLLFRDDEGAEERAIPMSLLDYLKIPTVNDLTVAADPNQPGPVALSPLLSFLSQPTIRLHTLALSVPYHPTMMEDLIKCLKMVPLLTTFTFHCPNLTNIGILVGELTGHVDFLPRLEHLRLEFLQDPPPRLTTSVVNMLCWRRTALGIAQLQSFWLLHYRLRNANPSLFLDLLKRESEIQRLEGEGMLLHVREKRNDEPSSF